MVRTRCRKGSISLNISSRLATTGNFLKIMFPDWLGLCLTLNVILSPDQSGKGDLIHHVPIDELLQLLSDIQDFS